MEDSELLNIIETEEHNALGFVGGDLTKERAENMEYYLGEPMGNEVEGRSQVQTRDVADTIEAMMPDVMNVLLGTDEIATFTPVGQEDEEAAEQESDYVNHVFFKENNGFLVLYSWVKDSFLQKNGYVKRYWDDSEEETEETYQNLVDQELSMLVDDDDVEVLEHTQDVAIIAGEQIQVHDVKIKRTKSIGMEKIVNLPVEEVLVASDANSPCLQDCRFVAHRTEKTYSELLEMGFDKEKLDKVPSDHGAIETEEEDARKFLSDEQETETSVDQSMRKITVTEAYIRVDMDDDGKAELWKVFKAGREILEKEKVDDIPIHSLTPMVLPHKHHGLCPADVVKEIQLTKTTLYRQMLDNMFLQNNGRFFVQGEVNINDLLVTRPLGIVRGDPNSSVTRLDTPQLPQQAFMMLEYMDKLRKERTGVGMDMQAMDPDVLAKTNTGVMNRAIDLSRAKIQLMVRVIAETGLKELLLGIHKDLIQHQDKQKVVKLRGKWVPVDPSQWKHRTDMTIQVGLGNGNVDQQLMHLGNIASLQERAGQALPYLVSPKNVFNMLDSTVKKAGWKVNEFFTDPESEEGKKLAEQIAQASEGDDPQTKAIRATLEVEMQRIHQQATEAAAKAQKEMMEFMQKVDNDREANEQKWTELELKFADMIEKAMQTNLPGSRV